MSPSKQPCSCCGVRRPSFWVERCPNCGGRVGEPPDPLSEVRRGVLGMGTRTSNRWIKREEVLRLVDRVREEREEGHEHDAAHKDLDDRVRGRCVTVPITEDYFGYLPEYPKEKKEPTNVGVWRECGAAVGRLRTQLMSSLPGFSGRVLSTCVACLLGVPVSQVPVLSLWKGPNSWTEVLRSWLLKEHRLTTRIASSEWSVPTGVTYVEWGTRRGNAWHAVIMQDGVLLHDPHPEGGGLEESLGVFYLVPLDPGEVRPGTPRGSVTGRWRAG